MQELIDALEPHAEWIAATASGPAGWCDTKSAGNGKPRAGLAVYGFRDGWAWCVQGYAGPKGQWAYSVGRCGYATHATAWQGMRAWLRRHGLYARRGARR